MKAFDIIGAIEEDLDEGNYSVKKEFFNIDQKQQIRIPISTKIQVDSIGQEIRKPKFHLVKPKQPQIHVINSKTNSVLGFDTQDQTWNTGTPALPPSRGFLSIFQKPRMNDTLENNIEQENQKKSYSPFEFLKERLGSHKQKTVQQQATLTVPHQQDHPSIINPPLFIGFPNNNHQEQEHSQNQDPEQPHYQPNQQNQIQRALIESQVEQVHLHNLPQTIYNDQDAESGIGERITQFFASLANKFGNKDQSNIQNQQQRLEKSSSKNSINEQSKKNFVQSEVQQYNPERKLGKTISRQIQIQQTIVIQHF